MVNGTVVGVVLVPLVVTVYTRGLPSGVLGLSMLVMTGVSLSVPPVPVPSSLMVVAAVPVAMVAAPVGLARAAV